MPANIIAFVHEADEQAKFSKDDIPEDFCEDYAEHGVAARSAYQVLKSLASARSAPRLESITAEIVTVDGSLVQKLAFNRYPGLVRLIAE